MRKGDQDAAMKAAVALLATIDPAGLSARGRAHHEAARTEFYRIEDGLD